MTAVQDDAGASQFEPAGGRPDAGGLSSAEIGDDSSDERAEPAAIGDQRVEPGRPQGPRGDRSHRSHEEPPGIGERPHRRQHLQDLGGAEPLLGTRRGREQDRVVFTGGCRDHRSPHDRGVGRRPPAVDGQTDDVGAGGLEHLVEAVGARAVMLHRDALVGHPLGEQELLQLRCGLGLGHPVGCEAGLLDGSARLRAPGDDLSRSDGGEELLEQPGFVHGLDPASEADSRRDHDDVRRLGDQQARAGDQLFVIDVRNDRQRGCEPHRRTVPFQCGGELARAPVDGKEDRAARQGGRDHRGGAFRACGVGTDGTGDGHRVMSPAASEIRAGSSRSAAATCPNTMTAGLRTAVDAASATTVPSVAWVVR